MPLNSGSRNAGRGALVVGSTGLIGSALMRVLPAMFQPVWGTVRGGPGGQQITLDLAQPVLAEQSERQAFTDVTRNLRCAFLCSAISRFSDCASNPGHSFKVNVTHTLELSEILLQHGVTVIHLSSNAIFDGKRAYCDENASPNPITEYGRQKAAAEVGLKALLTDCELGRGDVKIIRLTKVLSSKLPLISNWIRRLKSGQSITAFSDLIFAPVSLRYAAAALMGVAANGKSTIHHVSGGADISYFDFARKLAEHLGVNSDLVHANCIANLATSASAPRHSALGMSATTQSTGVEPQGLDEVIEDLIEETLHEE